MLFFAKQAGEGSREEGQIAALVMARMMKRLAVKYADLGLAQRARYLEKEALSALKNRQSALSNPREIISVGQGTSTTTHGKKHDKQWAARPIPAVLANRPCAGVDGVPFGGRGGSPRR